MTLEGRLFSPPIGLRGCQAGRLAHLRPRWRGRHWGAWALRSTNLAQAWPCFLTSLCLSGFVCRMGIRSTSPLRLLGVSGLPLEQESLWGCVRFLSALLMPSPSGRGGDSMSCAVSPREHVIQACSSAPGRGPAPHLSPHFCSHRRPGHCRTGSQVTGHCGSCVSQGFLPSARGGQRQPWSPRPSSQGPPHPRPVAQQASAGGAEEERHGRTHRPWQ